MKKFSIMFSMLMLLCATSLFAAPSEKVVEEVIGEVGYVWAQTGGLASIVGVSNHPNMTIKKDLKKGTIVTYKNFPTKEIIDVYNAALLEEGEKPYPVHFDSMSGPISIKMSGLLSLAGKASTKMEINVTLKGGTRQVKTLYIKMHYKGENQVSEVIIKANGKRYRNLEKAFKEGDKEFQRK